MPAAIPLLAGYYGAAIAGFAGFAGEAILTGWAIGQAVGAFAVPSYPSRPVRRRLPNMNRQGFISYRKRPACLY